jgi:protein-tyrosine phosphatase
MRSHADQTTPTILFLCSGNYYRSRFAELLFNGLASTRGCGWIAESRALCLERGSCNVGPYAPEVPLTLREHGVEPPAHPRMPLQVTTSDLRAAGLVVALCEREHRTLLAQRFPEWENGVEYWHIEDKAVTPAARALPQIVQCVEQLLARLTEASVPVSRG